MNNIQIKFGLAISFPKTTWFPLQDSNSKFSCASINVINSFNYQEPWSSELLPRVPRPMLFIMILLGCPSQNPVWWACHSSKMAAKSFDELKFEIFENLFQDNWDENWINEVHVWFLNLFRLILSAFPRLATYMVI